MTGILTETANLTNSYQYDPYGNLTSGTADGVNYYGYNGESTNVKTGLQYLRARYYNAENGTFTTEDSDLGTTENPLTRNRYDYTTNNPLNYSDPTGHSLWSRIKGRAKKAAKAVKSVGKKIVNTAKKVVKTVVNTIKKVTRTVKNAVKGTAQKVKNIVTHPKQTYESAKKNITRTYGNVVSRGSSFIRSASKNVKKTGKKYYSSFKSYVSDRTKEIRKNVKRELCTTTNRISTSLEKVDWDTVAKVGISVGIIGGLGLATILTGGSIMEGKNQQDMVKLGIAAGISQGVVGGGLSIVGNSAFGSNVDNTVSTKVAKGIYNYMGEVFGMGAGLSTEMVSDIYKLSKKR